MRLKAKRGEKYQVGDEKVTFLEAVGDEHARVIGANGMSRQILMDELPLPIIETKDYEKIAADIYARD